MKLFYAPTSPFARKVRVTARELQLGDRIELVLVNPCGRRRRSPPPALFLSPQVMVSRQPLLWTISCWDNVISRVV
ncbi:glutathione S-transferase N-terminal domain-containing protein [Sorangium sp. So ce269]